MYLKRTRARLMRAAASVQENFKEEIYNVDSVNREIIISIRKIINEIGNVRSAEQPAENLETGIGIQRP